MSGAVMTNNSMEDVASKFGNNWGRLAAVIVIWRNPVKFHRVAPQNHTKNDVSRHCTASQPVISILH